MSGDHELTCAGAGRVAVYSHSAPRRRWPAELKAQIVAESYASTVSEVAARYMVSTTQIFGWRRAARRAEALSRPQPQEQPVRRVRRRRGKLGGDRQPHRELQAQRCEPTRLPDRRPHQAGQPLAQQPYRRAHPLGLGRSEPLTNSQAAAGRVEKPRLRLTAGGSTLYRPNRPRPSVFTNRAAHRHQATDLLLTRKRLHQPADTSGARPLRLKAGSGRGKREQHHDNEVTPQRLSAPTNAPRWVYRSRSSAGPLQTSDNCDATAGESAARSVRGEISTVLGSWRPL
jgi:transposase-like protein